MHTKKLIARAVAAALIAGSANAVAQASLDNDAVERIAVTGSSIKRTDLEGALPITTLSAEDIAKTGVTSVPDLIATIPSMQGFTTGTQSVGGGGAGISSASLRGIGDEYTLVLLNGKRLAPAGSGSAVDVNSIPISAIERVEVLTDGASALYGSDAIAGVVNFILKKDIQETTFDVRYDVPEETGGENYTFNFTTGFGDLSRDGFNVFVSYMREDQEALASRDREHARTGIIPFNYNGQDLVFVADSSNAIPATATLRFNDGYEIGINPFREMNGQCAPDNVPSDTVAFLDGEQVGEYYACRYDFTSTLEIVPEYTRDNLIIGGVAEINDSAEVYSTVSYSRFELTSRIAPYPTGNFPVAQDNPLFAEYIYPSLPAEFQERVDNGELVRSTAAWRSLPGGNRTNEYTTDSLFLDLGIRGEWNSTVSYDFSVTYSDSEREDVIITGYPIQEDFLALLSSGDLDVFTTADNLSEEEISALRATMYSGLDTVTDTELLTVNGNFSAPVFELPAGDVYLGGGFDYRETTYSRRGSEANQRAVILFSDADPQFDLERETYGIFLETIVPVFEGFEVTAAVRYDDISAVENTVVQNPIELAQYLEDGTIGGNLLTDIDGNVIANGFTSDVSEDLDDTTYKVSASYRPNENWLLRASVGTGFKAPTMREIAEPLIPFGVTGGTFACPFPSSDPMAAYCVQGLAQYDVFRQGNPNLNPEESEQLSVGFVYSGDNGFSVSVDYWEVDLENVVQRPTEANIFNDPDTYRELYTTKFDEGLGQDVLAIIQGPVNVGEQNNAGIDWTVNFTNEFGWADLKTSLSGTYIIESESLQVGSTDVFETSLGRKGPDDDVVFRNKIRIVNTLSHGDFVHTLNIAYQSGYADSYFPGGSFAIRNPGPENDLSIIYDGGVQLKVPSHTIVDWVTRYNYNQNLTVSAGINNLFDKLPPLAFGEGGGHQEGFDPRYFDSYGRTFYLQSQYKF